MKNMRGKMIAAALALALVATCSGTPCAFAEASLEAGQIASGAVATKATMAKKSKKIAIKKAKVKNVKSCTYTGSSVWPKKVKLVYKGKKLKANRDYDLSIGNCVNAGTGRLVFTGKGRFKGKKVVKFKIAKADIAKAIDQSEFGAFERTGKAIKPTVSLMYEGAYQKYWLKAGRDYTVSYKNNVEAGTASAVVTGKGNFKGAKTLKFEIVGFKVEEKSLWMFSNWGGCVYADDPTAIYPCNTADVDGLGKIPFKEVSLGDGIEKVSGSGQTYYVMEAPDFNQPTTELVRMPDGLAEAVWESGGYTKEVDYYNVWQKLLRNAYESPSSCQDTYAARGIDVPLWFSEALYDIDHLYNGDGNVQTTKKWFLV